MTIDHSKVQRLATQSGVPSHHRQDKMLMESVRQMMLAVRQESLRESAAICVMEGSKGVNGFIGAKNEIIRLADMAAMESYQC